MPFLGQFLISGHAGVPARGQALPVWAKLLAENRTDKVRKSAGRMNLDCFIKGGCFNDFGLQET